MLNAIPVVAFDGTVNEKWEAATTTLIEFELPVMEDFAESVAVTVCTPAVLRVTEKVPVPFESAESLGSTACASLLVKCTVPE
jgi:hypothetical protein